MLSLKTLKTAAWPRAALAAVAAMLVIGATSTDAAARSRHRHHSHSMAVSPGYTFSGVASYYGNEAGRRTASGQRFNQNAMTAAHRSLPFGTRLRVSHGGRSIVVTINDRGPFIRGRVLDLSAGAARAIGLTHSGVGRITAEVIS
ncbi:MAG: septal ring lytic transglycosylase RlpA family protein [Alphaproteobacteria bacterium]|nr:septal ring lytic transglycosylase RlpA family protein [Alphaproteobacteria bacterium]